MNMIGKRNGELIIIRHEDLGRDIFGHMTSLFVIENGQRLLNTVDRSYSIEERTSSDVKFLRTLGFSRVTYNDGFDVKVLFNDLEMG